MAVQVQKYCIGKGRVIFHRQRGSHMVYYHPKTNHTVIVPRHRDIKHGTPRVILKEAELSREEFLKLLHD